MIGVAIILHSLPILWACYKFVSTLFVVLEGMEAYGCLLLASEEGWWHSATWRALWALLSFRCLGGHSPIILFRLGYPQRVRFWDEGVEGDGDAVEVEQTQQQKHNTKGEGSVVVKMLQETTTMPK